MQKILRIGTRDSQLAVWQATLVQDLLKESGTASELVFIKSEGDVDTLTPLYELGVQGIFTKTLDAALLNNRIDIAVHSMKDVPTKLADGIQQAAVLKRASHKDIFVAHPDLPGGKAIFSQPFPLNETVITKDPQKSGLAQQGKALPPGGFGWAVATSSIRRIAQWLHRYPNSKIENLRGNVNTRLRKLKESNWHGAIFAAAGLERIGLRPQNAIDLDWMLPAPAQGAIMIVCRQDDDLAFESCKSLNNEETALCTKIEKDFLRILMGGCSTPISALAEIKNDQVLFKGNICSMDGRQSINFEKEIAIHKSEDLGITTAQEWLQNNDAQKILTHIRNAKN